MRDKAVDLSPQVIIHRGMADEIEKMAEREFNMDALRILLVTGLGSALGYTSTQHPKKKIRRAIGGGLIGAAAGPMILP